MRIENMFYDDINREINGVIKVDQDQTYVAKQEVDEYVITRELKKHFVSFFNYYANAFDKPTDDIGVWISGFFGSGKSHFLKMLSYILENKEVDGKTTVERFRPKFQDDPATFMLIDKCTKTPADTILFNIDIEGPMNKDKTAVMQVFAKMFYNHLGYYGKNLKVAKLEQYVDKKGKLEEFKKVFEVKNDDAWIDSRDVFDFCEDEIVETLMEVMGMSETAARNWFNGSEEVNLSIASLVEDIKEYVDSKPDNYRLVFMIDEVGQYVGGDTSMLLNLQSLAEKIGSECHGKVWIMCTGQEAIDDIIRTRTDEFSRIQARFKTRLSLSSASADEVIQKRILRKNDGAKTFLEETYEEKRNEMANLFKFREAVGDIKGYESPEEFSVNFPFVPYQFIVMQKVFSEIRKHSHAGKHLSGGERSMLSGFQEAAQNVQEKDENAIVPFYMFYDTVHTFLDGSIRRVIERCERAIMDNKGLEEGDQNLLKLLYMIRYVDDIPAKIDNIIILMADDIRIDKLGERTKVQAALDRLIKQNYIARTGDTYNFLTDAEQDVEREITSEYVEPAEITKKVSNLIFGKIYTAKKFRYKKIYDFDFDKRVDDFYIGHSTDNMEIHIMTMATSNIDKNEFSLMASSKGKIICVLADTEYYNYLENAMKIHNYARKKNVSQLPAALQSIIRGKNEEAERYEQDAELQLSEAFKDAKFYIDGEKANIMSGTAKDKIDEAFSNLVGDVYRDLDMVGHNAESDEDILKLLSGEEDNGVMKGMENNRTAADEVERYLLAQQQQISTTTMADVQKRFQAIPYGWKEIDVAYVTARLIYEQKVTIKYNGKTIRADNKRLPELLRKKTEIGKTKIKKREEIPLKDLREVKEFMRDFFDVMDLPQDEDGLSQFIVDKFEELKRHYFEFTYKYDGKNYPDRKKIQEADKIIDSVLQAKSDNIALVTNLISMMDDLDDMQEEMEKVEGFFASQVAIFDKATEFEKKLRQDNDYFVNEPEISEALNKIRLIVIENPKRDNFDYNDIPKLQDYMNSVQKNVYILLDKKRAELEDIISQCIEAIKAYEKEDNAIKQIIDKSRNYYDKMKHTINQVDSLTTLASYVNRLWDEKDSAIKQIQYIEKSKEIEKLKAEQGETETEPIEPVKSKNIKKMHRQLLFPASVLESEDEIDKYLEEVKAKLKEMLKDCDGIDIN